MLQQAEASKRQEEAQGPKGLLFLQEGVCSLGAYTSTSQARTVSCGHSQLHQRILAGHSHPKQNQGGMRHRHWTGNEQSPLQLQIRCMSLSTLPPAPRTPGNPGLVGISTKLLGDSDAPSPQGFRTTRTLAMLTQRLALASKGSRVVQSISTLILFPSPTSHPGKSNLICHSHVSSLALPSIRHWEVENDWLILKIKALLQKMMICHLWRYLKNVIGAPKPKAVMPYLRRQHHPKGGLLPRMVCLHSVDTSSCQQGNISLNVSFRENVMVGKCSSHVKWEKIKIKIVHIVLC